MSHGEQSSGSSIRLNENLVRAGDVILTTSPEIGGRIIRLGTSSDISHAMVCVSYSSLIDATLQGVHARNIQRHFLDADLAVHVLRPKRDLTNAEIKQITFYMRGFIGTEYTVAEAMLGGLGTGPTPTKRQFCSRLVAQAFGSAGINLVANANYCSPEDIKRSPLLYEIPGTTLAVTQEYIDRWPEIPDVPKLMRDATNALLAGARSYNPGIQVLEDIDRHLIDHPAHDVVFCKLLEDSGYLTVGDIDRANNPWQYDLELMRTMPADESLRNYCRDLIESDAGGRFSINLAGYTRLAVKHRLRYFMTMIMLFDGLNAYHEQRVMTATTWLQENP